MVGDVVVENQSTGMVRRFPIAGKDPTPEELKAIEAQLRLESSGGVSGAAGGQQQGGGGQSFLGRAARSLLPQNVEDLAPLTIGVPSMLGATAGTPFGPPGMAAGGALGAAAGSLLQEGLADVSRATGDFGGNLPATSRIGTGVGGPLGPTKRALNEGALDLAIPSFAGAVVGSAKRGILRTIGSTIDDSGKRVAAYARELGVPLGTENVTGSRAISGTRRVLGKIPFLNKPFRDFDRAQAKSLKEVKERLLSDVAPIVTTTADLGTEASEAAFRRSKHVGGSLSAMYEDWIKRASDSGVVVPATTTRQVARDLIDTFTSRLPRRLVKGELKTVDPSKVMNQSVLDFARQLSTLQDMSAAEYQTLAKTINEIIAENADNRGLVRQAIMLKGALEADLENLIGPPELRSQIKGLNAAFGQYMDLLKSPTGRRIARATGGLGKIFVERTQEPQQLFGAVFNTRSPGAMGDLQRLVGRDSFSNMVRGHIEDAFETSFRLIQQSEDPVSKQFFEVKALRKALGFGRGRSPEKQSMQRALDLANGPSYKDFQKFFDVAEAALGQQEINISDFLSRRVVLGGTRSGLRALNPASIFAGGGAAGAGAIAAGPLGTAFGAALSLSTALAVRRTSRKLLTNPGVLKAATSLMDPNISISTRNQLLLRLTRLIGEDAVRDIGRLGEFYMKQLSNKYGAGEETQ